MNENLISRHEGFVFLSIQAAADKQELHAEWMTDLRHQVEFHLEREQKNLAIEIANLERILVQSPESAYHYLAVVQALVGMWQGKIALVNVSAENKARFKELSQTDTDPFEYIDREQPEA